VFGPVFELEARPSSWFCPQRLFVRDAWGALSYSLLHAALRAARHLTPCCAQRCVQQTNRCKTSLQWAWLREDGVGGRSDVGRNVSFFCCFAFFEYLLLIKTIFTKRM